MGLLSKKICSICGNDIGLLGNRPLADGNLCKNCASRLSPYFRGRKQSTIKEIEEHLNYRLANETELFNYKPTKVINNKTKIYLDENTNNFVVTRYDDYRKENPDIVNTSQILGMSLDIREDKDEIKKEIDGKEVSYEPKRYEYEYTFYLDIRVDSPYFEHIEIEIVDNDRADSKEGELYYKYKYRAEEIMHILKPNNYPEPILGSPEVSINTKKWYCPDCGKENDSAYCSNCGKERPLSIWYCPECGKENSGKFCVSCGTKRPN